MWNFENDTVRGIHYSRFVASWVKICRWNKVMPYFNEEFMDWLKSLGLPERDIINIRDMADDGKLELELSVEKYLKEHK